MSRCLVVRECVGATLLAVSNCVNMRRVGHVLSGVTIPKPDG